MTRLRVGACLSLTGRFGRFGRDAAQGLEVWRDLCAGDLALEIEDDGSDPGRLGEALPRIAHRSDVLLGPYSTQLMREAGRVLGGIDGVLWNHGGAGDDVQRSCPGRIVSVLAPTSRYAQSFVHTRAAVERAAPLWVMRGPGRFGRQVAAGAVAEAEAIGVEAVERKPDGSRAFEDVPAEWDLLSVGTFEDDVEIVKAARSAPRPPREVCSIAAGVSHFASVVERPDGIYGIAQWFDGCGDRPALGPPASDFVSAFSRATGDRPDYPALQAVAGAVVAMHCAELAGSLEREALWAAAVALDTSTLLGAFAIDSETGAQTAHHPVLVRWRDGQPMLAE
jgi:ABC-type branched-subunit amino acid transport system substrate-binding protein